MQRSTSIAVVAALLSQGLAACTSAKKPDAAPVAATGTTTTAPTGSGAADSLQAAFVHIAAAVDPSAADRTHDALLWGSRPP
jgi:Flp pilus assembly protein TadD